MGEEAKGRGAGGAAVAGGEEGRGHSTAVAGVGGAATEEAGGANSPTLVSLSLGVSLKEGWSSS
jgi:hypothetical protein